MAQLRRSKRSYSRSRSRSRSGSGSKRVILRAGYSYMRNGKRVRVSPKYIADKGKPGKGPQLIPKLKKGQLGKYGYSHSATTSQRHVALHKAIKAYGYNTVIRKLNAICVLNRNTNPSSAKIFCRDKRYVMRLNKSPTRAKSMKKSRSKRRSR